MTPQGQNTQQFYKNTLYYFHNKMNVLDCILYYTNNLYICL